MTSASPSVVLIRAAVLYVPVLAVIGAALQRHRTGRPVDVPAAVITTGWTLAAVLVVSVAGLRAGWWHFPTDSPSLAGVPVDLWLGWTLLWGPLPVLVGLEHRVAVGVGLVAFDLLAMPALAPVVELNGSWLVGEAVAIAVVLVPGLALATWTAQGRRLLGRVGLQIVAFTVLLAYVVPTAAMALTGGSWAAVTDRPAWHLVIAIAVVGPTQAMAVQSVRELAHQGGGTPVPLDPPVRLVTTGPYAYVANPLQVSGTVLLLVVGVLTASPGVVVTALGAAAFSVGVAAWIEDGELDERFAEDWRAWRRQVAVWRPRLRPATTEPATVFVDQSCDPCRTVGRFLDGRHPTGLLVTAADDHAERLTRITYQRPRMRAEGIEAIARSLEHAHLGWAVVSWIARLPGVQWVLQLVTDVVGGGPRPAGREVCEAAPAGR